MNMQGLYSVEIFSTLFDVMNGAIKFQSIYLYFWATHNYQIFYVIYDYTNYKKIKELQKHDIITMELDNSNVKYDA